MASAKKKTKPSTDDEGSNNTTLPFEIDPEAIEASLANLRDSLTKWAKKGRYTKVRFKFRGKQLLPDIPLAAVLAVEGITFYWTGLLRALVVNLAGQTVFDVELVNDSASELAQGKERLLSGELDEALAHFRKAEEMDHDNTAVHLNLGVALRLKGDLPGARAALEHAVELCDEGDAVANEAKRLLEKLPPV